MAASRSMRLRSVEMTSSPRRTSIGISSMPSWSAAATRRRRLGSGSAPEEQQHSHEVGDGTPGANQDQAASKVTENGQTVHVHCYQQEFGAEQRCRGGKEEELKKQERPVAHSGI